MDPVLRRRLEEFLLPLYQDVDGASRFPEVQRIATIARRLHAAAAEEAWDLELLLLFHRLGPWLEKVGNLSRVTLSFPELGEAELRRTAASIRRLDDPQSPAECAAAAAVLIDGAGVRGLVEQFAGARREGNSIMDVVRIAVADVAIPEWLPDGAEELLFARREARREVCRKLLEELE